MKLRGLRVSLSNLWLPAATAGLLLAAPTGAAAPEKKEPAKKARSEEDTLEKALAHLKQYATLVQQLREAESRKKCADNLRQIGVAVHKFHADAVFPRGNPWMKGPPQAGLFWHLLPYLEQDSLYRMAGSSTDRLGARLEPVEEALASQLDLPKEQGLL